MALSVQERILIEQRVTNESKSTTTAFLLWFFLWMASAHRFYLGRPATAILQILSYFVGVGFIWLIVDAFLIPGMVREHQEETRRRLTTDALISQQ